MPAHVRTLTNADLPAVTELLARRPFENVFVASRIRTGGLEAFMLGCDVWGYEEDGELVSILHNGANMVPVNGTPDALDAYVMRIGPIRTCASILGVADEALSLYDKLCRRWPGAWQRPREIRSCQPLMVISGPPTVPADPRVRRIGPADAESYFEAAVSMYTEEVGVSPLDGTNGYRWYVDRLLETGCAMGIVEDGRVIFKTDVGSYTASTCQVAGVWLRPELRGRGRSIGAMAGVVDLCREQWQNVTLYVNDYNTPARALYRRVGFDEVGAMATVLY
jgi:uncharacterized protein